MIGAVCRATLQEERRADLCILMVYDAGIILASPRLWCI